MRTGLSGVLSDEIQSLTTALDDLQEKCLLSLGASLGSTCFDLAWSSWSGMGQCLESFGDALGRVHSPCEEAKVFTGGRCNLFHAEGIAGR